MEQLLPINEVARCLGIRASTIRYYEERGLVEPAAHRGGKRWFHRSDLRRLAIIRFWQSCGLMSLDKVAELLAGPVRGGSSWADTVEAQLRQLSDQIERMSSARDLLEHVRSHHPDIAPDGCPHYEALLQTERPDIPRPPHAEH